MSNLTISVDEDLKKQVIKKAKKDRMTVSFLVHQMFKNYLSDSFEVKIVPKNAMLEPQPSARPNQVRESQTL